VVGGIDVELSDLLEMEQASVTVTEELLEAGKSANGGWSKEQLALLGVAWPPASGWKNGIVGHRMPKASADKFVQLGHRGKTEPSGQEKLF
jgi:hypothetical protein